MAYNPKRTEKVRTALAHLPHVEEKKMFRGIAFMVNGKLCISVGDQEIMCRINPALHGDALRKKGCRTVVMRGRDYKGYVYVHEEALENKQEFDYWVSLALDFNKEAKASRKKSRK